MCFDKVMNGKYEDVQVATEDIKCYKKLYLSTYGNIISPYQGMKYFSVNTKESKVIKKAKFVKNHKSHGTIYNGLHTYSNKKIALNNSGEKRLYDAIIPKGTKYYYNPSRHEYVSEKLIVYNKIKKIKK